MLYTFEQIDDCFPDADSENVSIYYDDMMEAAEEFSINTDKRMAGWISQLAVESANLTAVRENLNYSAVRLRQVFGKYFPSRALAEAYARNPQMIANRVYANRMNNGDERSGDGWKYRGRGLIQLTGKYNYTKCGEGLGIDLLSNPDYLETPEGAVRSAAWYWGSRSLNDYADRGDIEMISRRVNGGTHGMSERKAYYYHALEVLGG